MTGNHSRSKPSPLPEQKEADAALRSSEVRLRAVLETAVDGIITIDASGEIESFNPAAERIFGYRADEVIGQNLRILMPPPYREEHDNYIRRYLDTGRNGSSVLVERLSDDARMVPRFRWTWR